MLDFVVHSKDIGFPSELNREPFNMISKIIKMIILLFY